MSPAAITAVLTLTGAPAFVLSLVFKALATPKDEFGCRMSKLGGYTDALKWGIIDSAMWGHPTSIYSRPCESTLSMAGVYWAPDEASMWGAALGAAITLGIGAWKLSQSPAHKP